MIRLEDLHKSFSERGVLRGVSLQVRKGEIVALIGRSGYGKSVLLKLVSGLMRPDRGHVLIDGKDMCCLTGGALRRFGIDFGFVFQRGALFDYMTVFDNVAFPLRKKTKLSEKEIREKVLHQLYQVGLMGAEHKYPAEISGGMIKRTALARALVTEPEIMLLDEPTTGLDPIIAQAMLNLIDSCHKNLQFTGILVTHQIPRVFEIVDKVAMLHEGIILTEGSPQEMLLAKDPIVKQFIRGDIEGPIEYH